MGAQMTKGELEVLLRERRAAIRRALRRSDEEGRRIRRIRRECERRSDRALRALREAGVLK
jgi:hypothetical protein